MASTEDSPIANKLKRIWFKTPIGEEQATQAVLDPVVGKFIEQKSILDEKAAAGMNLFLFSTKNLNQMNWAGPISHLCLYVSCEW